MSPDGAKDPKPVSSFYDALAERRARYHRIGRYYLEELSRFYRLNISRGASVLEVGCGVGDLLAAVAEPGRGTGIDLSPRMVEEARRRFPALRFEVQDAQDLRLAERFDAVIASDLVGDLPDVQAFFRSAASVLEPDGRLLVDFYNPLWEAVLQAGEAAGLRMRRPPQNWLPLSAVRSIASLEGLEVVRATGAFLFPFWIPGLSAFLNHYLAKLPGFSRLALLHRIVLRKVPAGAPEPLPSVSVIVPCRNEAGNIEPIFRRTPDMGAFTELVFVDGSSADGTVEEIRRQMERHPARRVRLVLQGEGRGKGDAVRKGFAAAEGEILMILDADITVVPEDLPKFYEAIRSGRGELINGTRRVYPMEGGAMRLINRFGNLFFSVVFRWLLDQQVTDTLCGTKVLRARDWRRILEIREREFGESDPFGDFDLIFGAVRLNRKILEVPIRYRARTYGETKIRRFWHGWMLLKMCALGYGRLKRW